MQKSNERLVKFFDLRINASGWTKENGRIQLPPKSLLELLQLVEAYFKNNDALKENRSRTETWYLSDISVDPKAKRAVLLINRSDRMAADSVVTDPKAKVRRVLSKSKGQGNDFSAHMVLKLVPNTGAQNDYLALLEASPGISSGVVTMLLRFLVRNCGQMDPAFFEYNHPDGEQVNKRPKKIKARYTVDLAGHPSTDFVAELNNGVLDSIEIIDTTNANNVWDQAKKTLEKATVIHLKPRSKTAGASWFQIVKDACATAHKKNMSEAKIRFTNDALMKRTVVLETRTVQIANEDRFVRKEKLDNFSSLLPTSFEDIHDEISKKMVHIAK